MKSPEIDAAVAPDETSAETPVEGVRNFIQRVSETDVARQRKGGHRVRAIPQ